ncbi:MAG: hypothetical protein ACC657_08655 [Thiohalomonadales bacterium]
MVWVNFIIIGIALAVIIFSIPKLKSKYQTSSQETQEKIMLYVPLVLPILGAILLISVVR